jgi:hypothetical protein
MPLTTDAPSPDPVFARASDCVVSEIDGALVMLRVGTGEFCGLDGTAEAIVRALETPMRFADLVDRLAARYDAGRAEIAPDTAAFLAQMVARKLIIRTD